MTPPDLVTTAIARLRDAELLSDVAEVTSRRRDGIVTVIVVVPLVAPASTTRRVQNTLSDLPHEVVIADRGLRTVAARTGTKDGVTWRIGCQDDVCWINDNARFGTEVTTAIPAQYDAYATLTISPDDADRLADETALVEVLRGHGADESWWLGYLDTGAHDVVFDLAPKVVAYSGWGYVLVQAGPDQALTWRADDPWRGRLPDLMFPADRRWLVSMLWDDDWRCIGGPDGLITAVVDRLAPRARQVTADEDATPPGHTAR